MAEDKEPPQPTILEQFKARKFDQYGWLPYAPILQHVQEIEDSRTPELDPETSEAFDQLFANFKFEDIKSILACSLSGEPDAEEPPHAELPLGEDPEPTLLELGELASQYMPAYLKQIAEANKSAQPRDPAKDAYPTDVPGTTYIAFEALGKETRYYAHWLASQGRHKEASDAILTVLDLLKLARFGTKLDTLCLFAAAGELDSATDRLLLSSPAEQTDQLGNAFLEASGWILDWVLYPAFELNDSHAELEAMLISLSTERVPDKRESLQMEIEVSKDVLQRMAKLALSLRALRTQPVWQWSLPEVPSEHPDEQVRERSDRIFLFNQILPTTAQCSSDLKMVAVHAKIRSYFWQHGSMPKKLEYAMSSDMILDPANGESYHYEQLNQYSFRLRSNGRPGLFPTEFGVGRIFPGCPIPFDQAE